MTIALLPELKLLCGLRFFDRFDSETGAALESYLREFIPTLADAACKCNPDEFLPEEAASLARLLNLLKKQDPGGVNAEDLKKLETLHESILSSESRPESSIVEGKSRTVVTGLFAEYYPDLDLSPRGRLLNLAVSVTPISQKVADDDVNVRNPVEEPDDRFLEQARDSVHAARQYLLEKYGLSARRKYRFDFALNSTGARFTGDSLGVAFAVGAVVALSRIEVFRERLSVSPDVAFSGALSPGGELKKIDSEALKLKIYRAFHSDVKYLLIPREHITEAWKYLSELEEQAPERKLELVGADRLDAVVSDQRLVPAQRLSLPAFAARRAVRARRSMSVEVPALLVMLYLLICLIYPKAWIGFDWNPQYVKLTKTGFEALNADSVTLWSVEYECKSIEASSVYEIGDLDNDDKNEVAFAPAGPTVSPCKSDGNFYVYDDNGRHLFDRYCAVLRQYPGDSLLTRPYRISHIKFRQWRNTTIILTAINESYPARAHIRLWNTTGDSIGWYINSGAVKISDSHFLVLEDLGFVFFGINNRTGSACLFVLPADSVYGVSPPYSDSVYGLENVRRGNQLYYLSFPPSDINVFLQQEYNSTRELRFDSDQTIKAVTSECGGTMNCFIDYYLDENFRVTDVKLADDFVESRQMMAKEGLMPDVGPMYTDSLLCKVTYWTDRGWVSEGELRAAENK